MLFLEKSRSNGLQTLNGGKSNLSPVSQCDFGSTCQRIVSYLGERVGGLRTRGDVEQRFLGGVVRRSDHFKTKVVRSP